jgi:uncharacterized protein YdaU (DUF1376 family)
VKERTLPIMPFYVRDYIAATRSMTLAERGAYTDLLFAEWDSGGPLPKDLVRLATMIGCKPKEFAPLWAAIKNKFVKTASGYVNRRLEEERRISLAKRARASDKAAAASAARWERSLGDTVSHASGIAPSNAPSIGQAMHMQCPPSPSPYKESPERAAPRKRARPAGPDGQRARPDALVDEDSAEVQHRRQQAAALAVRAASEAPVPEDPAQ